MKKLIFIFIWLGCPHLPAQSDNESLKAAVHESIGDTTIIRAQHQLFDQIISTSPEKARPFAIRAIEHSLAAGKDSWLRASYCRYAAYWMSQSSFDSAIYYYNKGLEFSDNDSLETYRFDAVLGLGYAYWSKGDHKNANRYHQMHLDLSEQKNDQLSIADSHILLSSIYTESGEYTKAMALLTSAAKIYHQLNAAEKLAKIWGNIGFLHRRLENYASSVAYLRKSDSLYQIIGDRSGMAFIAHNLAVIHKNKGELKKALEYNTRSLKDYELLGNKKRMAYCQYTMGEIYKKLGNLTSALTFYEGASSLAFEVKDSLNLGYSLVALGNLYDQMNRDEEAISNLQKALGVAVPLRQDLLQMEVHESLSQIYERKGDYQNAYKAMHDYAVIRDSFYNREKRDLASDIEAKYQNEQKAKEIALLGSENELKNLLILKRVNERNTLIAFALILLVLAALIYNQYRIKQRTNRELKVMDTLKSNFFANISHEFRTPLTLIKGPIDYLEQNPDERLSVEDIKMVRRNTNRVLNMVNQLLDLSKIDQGSLTLSLTEGDVYRSMRATASAFSSHAAQRQIDYRISIPQSVYWTAFDRDKLENIIYNLLGNAFKYSEDGAVIAFMVEPVKDGIQLEVSDTGRGITAENLPFIFDRFYQADDDFNKKQEGTGIGLSLSKELITLMDGSITVSSEVTKGTFFTVQLPLQEIQIRSEAMRGHFTEQPVSRAEKVSYNFGRPDLRDLPVIVLVEDNADMCRFIKDKLIGSYKVTATTNGVEGLQKAIDLSPDLIISDLMMPKMDGIELCKQLKSDLRTSHIPIILLTAKAGLENKLEGLETGADDYLTKPFDGMELLVRVKNLIGQRQKLRALFGSGNENIHPKNITVTSIDQKFLEGVLELLESHFSNSEFGVPQMQAALAMSKTQLHRKLKALTNEAPGELLRNFRLKRAAQLLASKQDTVTQIAYKVGFNNLSYFAKCFKGLYGVAPSAYLG